MRRGFFQAAVVWTRLYGWTTWTLTEGMEKKIDGNYSRMMRAILNKSWRHYLIKQQLYDLLPAITKTIKIRQTRYAGHCWRCRDEIISDIFPWTSSNGRAKAEGPAITYKQQFFADTGCRPEDLPEEMDDRKGWWERSRISVLIAWHDDDDDICIHRAILLSVTHILKCLWNSIIFCLV